MIDHNAFAGPLMYLLVVIATTLFAAQTTAEEYAARGVELAKRGQWQDAEAALKRAVAISALDPAILGTLGGILATEHKLSEAQRYLSEAVALAPLDQTLRRNLAVNEWQLGKLREARSNLEKIIANHPDDRKAVLFLGMVAENQHAYPEAARLLGSVPELTREEPTATLALASALYAVGDQQGARAQLGTVPQTEEFLFIAAQTATQAADYETSLALLRPLIERIPVSNRVQALAGRDLAKLGKTREAVDLFQSAIDQDPGTERNYEELAAVLIETGRFREALSVASNASKRFPSSPELLAQKGACAMQLEYFVDAAAAYQQACRLKPESAAFRRGLAVAQWKAGTRSDAVRSFNQLLRGFPRDWLTDEMYGTLLMDSGGETERSKGAALLREALRLNPACSVADLYLGNLALDSGGNEEARRYYEAGLAHDPANAKLHFGLSRVLRRLGRISESEKELESYRNLTR